MNLARHIKYFFLSYIRAHTHSFRKVDRAARTYPDIIVSFINRLFLDAARGAAGSLEEDLGLPRGNFEEFEAVARGSSL